MFSRFSRALFLLEPEKAHRAAIVSLRAANLFLRMRALKHPMLEQEIFGLKFKNPIGMAAGFDKNAEAVEPLLRLGFGFVEAGTVTPLAQEGNPQPRVFRLREDEAVINRLGFNGEGLDVFQKNIARTRRGRGIVGINIGKNKDGEALADYQKLLTALAEFANYVTINISSPNTQGLRSLQQKRALDELLAALMETREKLHAHGAKKLPLLVKIAPDLTQDELADIAEVALARGVDGLIVSNTTIKRPASLKNEARGETGGLSGKPLFAPSTATLKEIYKLTHGKIPLVGVGGIASAEDAYTKIRAGASLIQLYTALIYQGFGLVRRIHEQLPVLLARDGFSHLRDAVGVDCQ